MSIQFYKPNARITGSACSFWYNQRDKCFFACIIKQDGWDAAARTGSFSKNKENPDMKVVIKMSALEIASIIDSLETNRETKGYHDVPSGTTITTFSFGPYKRDDSQVGFSFSATKSDKKDTTKKSSFIIGFNFGEGRLLRQQLICLLDQFIGDTGRLQKEPQKPDEEIVVGLPPINHPADLLTA